MSQKISRRATIAWLLTLACLCPTVNAVGQKPTPTITAAPPSTEEIERRAFQFFWNESDPNTGLTKDRAKNIGTDRDTYTVCSTASTGYALAALPIGVEHHWVKREDAYNRAKTTLQFIVDKLPNNHGFFYHFVDWRNGERVWNCELSSIDSGLLVLGALACGQYFKGTDVQRLADSIYARMDWRWMQQGNRDADIKLKTLSMGWKPEDGWLNARWQNYSEASFLYLMALGAPTGHDLAPDVWTSWDVKPASFEGFEVLGGPGPLFMSQMCPGYFDLRGKADRQGYDWWRNFTNTHKAHVAFCRENEGKYRGFQGGIWGLTASDRPQPIGYGAQDPVEGRHDATIAPSAFLAGMLFVPGDSERALRALWASPDRDKFWGRYGFSNAVNVDKNWYDPDVIGIDLGMTIVALEDKRSGLIWKLIRSHPMYNKALSAAGMRPETADSYPSSGGTGGMARARSTVKG